eukprot:15276221-Alexandrium_andersonii.AAC.1
MQGFKTLGKEAKANHHRGSKHARCPRMRGGKAMPHSLSPRATGGPLGTTGSAYRSNALRASGRDASPELVLTTPALSRG